MFHPTSVGEVRVWRAGIAVSAVLVVAVLFLVAFATRTCPVSMPAVCTSARNVSLAMTIALVLAGIVAVACLVYAARHDSDTADTAELCIVLETFCPSHADVINGSAFIV